MPDPAITAGAYSLAAAAAWGAADFSGGLATKKSSAFGSVVVAHGTGLVFMLLLAVVTGDSLPDRAGWLWGVAAGISGGIGLASLYRALAVGSMGINAPVAAVLTASLPVLLSVYTEGPPTRSQILGFAIAVVSIWLIATPAEERGCPRGLGLAVLAGIGFSGFLVFSKFAGHTSQFWPLVGARIASMLLMAALLSLGSEPWRPERRVLVYMMIAGLLDSAGNALYVAATRHGRMDVAAVLSSFYPASTVLLARLLLNERIGRVQGVGVAAALLSIPLILAR